MDVAPVFVIMPAYNAGATVEGVFARVPEEARRRVARYVVLNDGSRDDTQAALERLAKSEPKLTLLRHETNRGYGATEIDLLDHAMEQGAKVVVLLHSDGQYAPEKIPAMLEPFDRDEADVVQGSRMLGGGARAGGMPLYKYIGNKALTAVENLAFGMNMAEYHSGYMAYSRRFLEAVPYRKLSASFDFDLEMIVLARVAGLRIREVPIPTRYAGERSHLNPVTYGLRVLRVVRRYLGGYYRDLLTGR